MRLKNFVQHYCYILKAADKRNSEIISFSNSKGIIQIYNGGIGIIPWANVPEEWSNCFYNIQQASYCYLYFKEYLEKTDYNGGYSGSWVKDDYNILLALYKAIKDDLERIEKESLQIVIDNP